MTDELAMDDDPAGICTREMARVAKACAAGLFAARRLQAQTLTQQTQQRQAAVASELANYHRRQAERHEGLTR